MSLDSRQLRIFLAVAELRHFGQAAERLGLVPSAVSGQIKRLEDRLGGPLFQRGRRTAVTLTPAGETFRLQAEAVLRRLAEAERIGRLACGGAAGTAAIGYVFSAAMTGLLSRLMADAAERFPDLTLTASPMDTPEQMAALADGRLDAGLVRPRPHYPDGIAARIVHREPLLVALAETHPLAQAASLTAGDLHDEAFIIPQFSEATGLADALARLASVGRFALPPTREVNDFVTAAGLAAAGLGVVLAPTSLARLALPGLAFCRLTDFQGVIELAFAWRTDGLAAMPMLGEALAAAPIAG
jgi:DNA-binding transcriptional LysR family regulator